MHAECLTQEAKRLFPFLSHFSNFYLVGGTALALQIGHRKSYDFDLFTYDQLPPKLFQKVKKYFSGEKISVSLWTQEQADIFVAGVKITFRYYPFKCLYKCKIYYEIPLLSLPEIGAAKARTLGRRAAYRDYVDLYFILSEKHVTLRKIIECAQKKYKKEFNARNFLEQLVYLGDITDTKVDFLRQSVSKRSLSSFFEKAIREYTQEIGLR